MFGYRLKKVRKLMVELLYHAAMLHGGELSDDQKFLVEFDYHSDIPDDARELDKLLEELASNEEDLEEIIYAELLEFLSEHLDDDNTEAFLDTICKGLNIDVERAEEIRDAFDDVLEARQDEKEATDRREDAEIYFEDMV